MKVINGHVNVLVDDDGVVRTARELVEGLVEAGKHIAKTESELRASLQALHKMATVEAQAKGHIAELEAALDVYRQGVADRVFAHIDKEETSERTKTR